MSTSIISSGFIVLFLQFVVHVYSIIISVFDWNIWNTFIDHVIDIELMLKINQWIGHTQRGKNINIRKYPDTTQLISIKSHVHTSSEAKMCPVNFHHLTERWIYVLVNGLHNPHDFDSDLYFQNR